PLGGSYYVESLTDRLEAEARAYFDKLDEMGGMIRAIELGFPQNEIHRAAMAYQKEVDAGERIIVGLNAFTEADEPPVKILRIKEAVERQQIRRLRERKKARSGENVTTALATLAQAAADNEFLMPPVLDAVRAEATVGEICDV